MVPRDLARDASDLFEAQFARQHHHVGPLREELHRLGVRDVALGGDMHLHARAPGVENGGEVGRDDGVDARLAGPVDGAVHLLQLVVVDDRIDREVGLHSRLAGDGNDPVQILEGEVGRRLGPHVQRADPEIDRVGPGRDGRPQRFVGPHRGHDFDIRPFHRYFFRFISPSANAFSPAVRAGSRFSVSSSASARSNRSEICCSVRRGISSRS